MAQPDLYGMPETEASRLQGDNDVLRAENERLRAAIKRWQDAYDDGTDHNELGDAEMALRATMATPPRDRLSLLLGFDGPIDMLVVHAADRIERLESAIKYVRARSAEADEILNEFETYAHN